MEGVAFDTTSSSFCAAYSLQRIDVWTSFRGDFMYCRQFPVEFLIRDKNETRLNPAYLRWLLDLPLSQQRASYPHTYSSDNT